MDLKSIRFVKGMTQVELQRRSGVFQSRISLAEKGTLKLRNGEKRELENALKAKGIIDWGGDEK